MFLYKYKTRKEIEALDKIFTNDWDLSFFDSAEKANLTLSIEEDLSKCSPVRIITFKVVNGNMGDYDTSYSLIKTGNYVNAYIGTVKPCSVEKVKLKDMIDA